MATIGETLMVEKATGKRVAKHHAADLAAFYISIFIMIRALLINGIVSILLNSSLYCTFRFKSGQNV